MLASNGPSTNILFHAVSEHFTINEVIIEDEISAKRFIKQRYSKVGLFRIIDQMLFIITINKLLNVVAKKRRANILIENQLNENEIPANKIKRVSSTNAAETIQYIKTCEPDILLVNGTRILSKKLLASTSAVIVNIHAGITPDYRGVHGAYWAYVNGDPAMAGVTLHYVDSGVDTGNIIGQSIITKHREDNFATYPLLQLAEGVRLLIQFLQDLSIERISQTVIISKGVSKQWYHPGFFEYLYYRFLHGIK